MHSIPFPYEFPNEALNLIYSKFTITNPSINITPLVFFSLPKPTCVKAWAPKQIATTGVLELQCENEKLTLENTIPHQKIKTQSWKTLPLHWKTKNHYSPDPWKPSFVLAPSIVEKKKNYLPNLRVDHHLPSKEVIFHSAFPSIFSRFLC